MTSFARVILLSLVLGLAAMSGTAVASTMTGEIDSVRVCKGSSPDTKDHCPVVPVWKVNSQGQMIWLSAPARIDGEADEPIAVFIKAFAASAVYWDGRLIGHNGRPANSAALEEAGFRDAVIPIPSGLSGPGVHRLQIQMSTMRAPVRLASPILAIRVAPFEEALQLALRNYLPALLTAGGMLTVILCLLLLGWKEGPVASLKYIIGAALFVTAQLTAESSRAFVQLLYPAQVVRLELVLICSSGFGLLLTAYLLQRFEVRKPKMILAVQAGLIVSASLLLPGFDEKIAGIILSSASSSMAVSGVAIGRRKSGALPLFLVLGGCLLLGLWMRATFLDRDFYIWTLVLFVLLLAHEAQGRGEAKETAGAAAPEPESLWLGSGSTRHLVSPVQIVRLAAADDYTEVFLADAAPVLHPEPLHKLLDRLPPGFVRVHRSHAVNLAHLESFRRGPKSSVTLSDQSVAPVSRRCAPKLFEAISA